MLVRLDPALGALRPADQLGQRDRRRPARGLRPVRGPGQPRHRHRAAGRGPRHGHLGRPRRGARAAGVHRPGRRVRGARISHLQLGIHPHARRPRALVPRPPRPAHHDRDQPRARAGARARAGRAAGSPACRCRAAERRGDRHLQGRAQQHPARPAGAPRGRPPGRRRDPRGRRPGPPHPPAARARRAPASLQPCPARRLGAAGARARPRSPRRSPGGWCCRPC